MSYLLPHRRGSGVRIFAKRVLGLLLAVFGLAAAMPYANAGIEHPKVKWRFKTQGPIRSKAMVEGDRIFFGSSDGFVYALGAADGKLAWKFQTNGPIVGSVAVSDRLVVAAGRGERVYALDRKTGELRWSFAMKPDLPLESEWEYFTAAPVFAGDRVYVGSGDGHLYALDAASGALDWKYATTGRVRAAPLIDDGVVYQPSCDDFVYALDETDGSLLWKFETAGVSIDRGTSFIRSNIFTQPRLQDGLLVFGSRDSHVYAVDVETQKEAWRFNYDTTWAMATEVEGQSIYVGWSTNDLVSSFDLHSGKENWQFKGESHSYGTPLVKGEDLYFGSADGHLYRLDKATGKKRWDYAMGSEIYSGVATVGDALIVGADDGFLYAIEEGVAPLKVVYAPSELPGSYKYFLADAKIAHYLVERGFERIETSDALEAFVSARVADQAPSVVVFAVTYVPNAVMGEEPATGLMRQYLDSGGKVVWFGSVPDLFVLDEEGGFIKRDPTVAERFLDTEFIRIEDSGNYFAKATQEGLNWGLSPWFKNTISNVKDPSAVVPLGFDEFGRVGPWLKRFNPRPGSGFVSCRTWGFNVEMRDDELALVHELALHELE